MVHRGLETLEIRLERMCASALSIAERLVAHPAVEAVRHPGLPGDPSHEIARRQMRRFGALIGATFASQEIAERFIEGARFLREATSFGGVHSSPSDAPAGATPFQRVSSAFPSAANRRNR